PDEDHAVGHRRRPERGAAVLLPRHGARRRVESVHGWLLQERVARAVGVADAVRVAELTEGRAAVEPPTVEGRRADEAAREASEDDVRLPHQLASGIAGETIQDVVGPVLAALPDPPVAPEIDDVRRGPEVEVAGVARAGPERPPDVEAAR